MQTFEIWTDSEGRVLDPTATAIEQTIVAGVANGHLHPDDAETMRAELRGYAAAREEDTPAPISEDAYSGVDSAGRHRTCGGAALTVRLA